MTVVGIFVGLNGHEPAHQHRYVAAVEAAGGTPVLVPGIPIGRDRLHGLLERVDALLLSGGGDIDPSRYGAVPRAELDELDPGRDELELAALEWATTSNRRVLGICRGAQLMAVATGGTLLQDLPSSGYTGHKDQSGGYATAAHRIKTEPGSLADELLGNAVEVNSHHHQAVEHPGYFLHPTAWSEDGVVEALEGPHWLAVQWHPEVGLTHSAHHLRPFQWLVHQEGRWRA